MATQFEIDCALMAGASYISTRPDANKFPVPNGWLGVRHDQNANSGFEAISFINGPDIASSTEIVISIAGTGGSGDIGTDVALGLGMAADQLKQSRSRASGRRVCLKSLKTMMAVPIERSTQSGLAMHCMFFIVSIRNHIRALKRPGRIWI